MTKTHGYRDATISHIGGKFDKSLHSQRLRVQMENRDDRPRDQQNRDGAKRVLYGVEDVPSVGLCFLFGLQQAIMTIGGTISIPFILTPLICADGKAEVTSKLISITMFMCGLATVLQCIFGIRLGVIQGGSHTFVAPIVALMSLQKWQCPDIGDANTDEHWKSRMREIQGSLMVASLTQLLLGCTGLLGFVIRFIGPLTIAPTIALIGLSLTGAVMNMAKIHIGTAAFAMVLTLIFTLYLNKIRIPIPTWSLKYKWKVVRFPLFQLFPVILSICISWIFAYILTATDAIPNNTTDPSYMARTDARLDVLENVPWFYWPSPFQFGTPTVSAAGYVALLAATLSSIVESIGDYYCAARISGCSPPPAHAINRGIAIEGLASIVSGMVGAGHGTTTYSGNIGAIGITKVASRSVFITAGCMLVLCGVIGKLGAVLSLIPEPILGGTLAVLFGMVSAVGLSTLKFMDMDSTRNLTILGVSLVLGLMVPQYINDPNNANLINTGNEEFDSMLRVFLGTAMIVGSAVGFILDNTVPGTLEERGILKWRQSETGDTLSANDGELGTYDIPYITKYIHKIKCCKYVPVSPSFDKEIDAILICKYCAKERHDVTGDVNTTAMADAVFQNPVAIESVELEEKTNRTIYM